MGLWDDCGRGRGDARTLGACVARDYPGQRLADYLALGCSSCGGGQLGDIICTPNEAQAAEVAVGKMNTLFVAVGSPAKYKPLVDDINNRWSDYADSFFKSTKWCVAKVIGQDANELSARVATEYHLAPPTADPILKPGPTQDLAAAAETLVIMGVVGTVVWKGLDLLERRKSR